MRVWQGISFRIKPMWHSITSIERKEKTRRVRMTCVVSLLITSYDCRSIQSDRHTSCQSADTSWKISHSSSTEKWSEHRKIRAIIAFTFAIEHRHFDVSTANSGSNIIRTTNPNATQHSRSIGKCSNRLSSSARLVLLSGITSSLAIAHVSTAGSTTTVTTDESSSSC